jgi:glutaredoxin 3
MNVVWSKPNCPFCVKAKALLDAKGIKYEVREIGSGFTREDLLAAVPQAKTVPQIFLDNKLIGGYNELESMFKE